MSARSIVLRHSRQDRLRRPDGACRSGGDAGRAAWPATACSRRFPGSYFLVSGAAMLLAFPLLLLMICAAVPAGVDSAGRSSSSACSSTPGRPTPSWPTSPIRCCGPGLRPQHPRHPPVRRRRLAADHGRHRRTAATSGAAFHVVSVMVLIGGLLWLWGSRDLSATPSPGAALASAIDARRRGSAA